MTVYTLFGQGATGQGAAGDATAYTLGLEFSVSQSCNFDGIWFSSPPGAAVLPQTIALFTTPGGTLVHSEAANWSGAAASGWVKASFASAPALTPGVHYVAAVLQNTAADWYSGTSGYWSSGAGSGGITSGILSAPNEAAAQTHQDQFHVGAALTFPVGGNGSNYWIDPEVSDGAANTVTGSLTVTPAFSDHQKPAPVVALPLAPGFASVKAEKHLQAMTVTPGFAVSAAKNYGKGGTPDRHHRRTWRPW